MCFQLCRAWGEGAHRAREARAGAAGVPGASQKTGGAGEEKTSKRNGDRGKRAPSRRRKERSGWPIFKEGG